MHVGCNKNKIEMIRKFFLFLVCIIVLYLNLNAQKSQTVVYEVNEDPFEIINDSLFLLHINKEKYPKEKKLKDLLLKEYITMK